MSSRTESRDSVCGGQWPGCRGGQRLEGSGRGEKMRKMNVDALMSVKPDGKPQLPSYFSYILFNTSRLEEQLMSAEIAAQLRGTERKSSRADCLNQRCAATASHSHSRQPATYMSVTVKAHQTTASGTYAHSHAQVYKCRPTRPYKQQCISPPPGWSITFISVEVHPKTGPHPSIPSDIPAFVAATTPLLRGETHTLRQADVMTAHGVCVPDAQAQAPRSPPAKPGGSPRAACASP
eukprot:366004-Chlamydomonas_euryale.AAC.7